MIAASPIYKTFNINLLMLLLLMPEEVYCQSTHLNSDGSAHVMIEDGQGGYILEDLVVERTVNLKGVTLEQDGSYSLLDFKPSTLFTSMNSGVGAEVNFQISFARHSTVLTADGQQELENIARAMRSIGKDVSFIISIHRYANQDPKGRKSLTKNRANTIMNILKLSQGVSSELSLDFKSAPTLKKNKRAQSNKLDYLGLTVINEGVTEYFSTE